jgi:hypothetical protein
MPVSSPIVRSCAMFWLLFTTGVTTAQSPWTQSKAGFYAQASLQGIPPYTQIFNGSTLTNLRGKYSEQSVQLYGEYGFTRNWTGIVSLPVRRTTRTATSATFPGNAAFTGLGNITLGIKRGFEGGGLKMAGTLLLQLPAPGDDPNGLRTGFDAFTAQPSFSIGKGLRRYYWYAYTGGGVRSDKYASFIQTGGECGVHFGRIWGIVFSEWMQSLENGTRQPLPANLETGLFMDEQSWWSYGLKMIVKTGRFTGLVFSAGGAVTGKNVANRPALSAGYFFKWE